MPNINLNQGAEYFCDQQMIDLEYDSDSCYINPHVDKCRQCYAFCKQDYTAKIRDEKQKQFISPDSMKWEKITIWEQERE